VLVLRLPRCTTHRDVLLTKALHNPCLASVRLSSVLRRRSAWRSSLSYLYLYSVLPLTHCPAVGRSELAARGHQSISQSIHPSANHLLPIFIPTLQSPQPLAGPHVTTPWTGAPLPRPRPEACRGGAPAGVWFLTNFCRSRMAQFCISASHSMQVSYASILRTIVMHRPTWREEARKKKKWGEKRERKRGRQEGKREIGRNKLKRFARRERVKKEGHLHREQCLRRVGGWIPSCFPGPQHTVRLRIRGFRYVQHTYDLHYNFVFEQNPKIPPQLFFPNSSPVSETRRLWSLLVRESVEYVGGSGVLDLSVGVDQLFAAAPWQPVDGRDN